MSEYCKVGWREWVSLPELNIPAIKAKIDTGAKTSALHTYALKKIKRNHKDYVKFLIHPLQTTKKVSIECVWPIFDVRKVRDSGGHEERRYVIVTPVRIGEKECPIEITLTNRENMKFRMLLGRSALVALGFEVQPEVSYIYGRSLAKIYRPS